MEEVTSSTLDHLIGQVYQAAMTLKPWESVLEEIRVALNWRTLNIVEFDPYTGIPQWSTAATDCDPKGITEYNEYFWRLDPTLPLHERILSTGRPLRLHELHPTEQLLISEFFNDYLLPNSASSPAMSCASFAIHPIEWYGRGGISFSAAEPGYEGFSDQGFRTFYLIARHIKQAFKISSTHRQNLLSASIEQPTSVLSTEAAAFLDQKGRVLTWNTRFEALRQSNSVFTLTADGSFSLSPSCRTSTAAAQLSTTIADHTKGRSTTASFFVQGNEGQYAVTCIPVPDHLMHDVFSYGRRRPVSLLTVTRWGASSNHINSEILQQRFSLTPKETLLVLALLEGKNLRQISATGGSGYETLRKRVASVLEKTDCQSQQELVATVLGDPSLRHLRAN